MVTDKVNVCIEWVAIKFYITASLQIQVSEYDILKIESVSSSLNLVNAIERERAFIVIVR